MPSWEYEISNPPINNRNLELWLQHSAGFIIFEDARKYAIEQLDSSLSDEKRKIAMEAIALLSG